MIKYIDKGTARQHLTDRLMESAINNFHVRAYVDDVYVDLIENRLPVWIDELQTYDVLEVRHGHWIDMGDFEQCSVCHGTHLKEFQTYYGKLVWVKTPYCPNCGAKMNLAEDE